MSNQIKERLLKYSMHKTEILLERVYLAIIDKIFDAENYDEFEMDSENNIFVSYSLKKDEGILYNANEVISEQITKKYRKKLEVKLEEEGYYVEYDDSDIHVYFDKPLKLDNLSEISSIDLNNNEKNILKFKTGTVVKAKLLSGVDDSGVFDFSHEND
jgi:hypothetical protein